MQTEQRLGIRNSGADAHRNGSEEKQSTSTERRSSGSTSLTGVTAGARGRARASIAAEIFQEHADQIAGATSEKLDSWLLEISQKISSANVEYQAARTRFQQADAERVEARDAYRSAPKDPALSSAWHACVQRAQQAQTSMRAARDALSSVQILGDLLQKEATGRGVQLPPGISPASGNKRKRRQAPPETCPYCTHTYTVRDGLASKLDGEGNRLHLRRCQCREKTPPCKNCPSCKGTRELMAVPDPEQQIKLCQETYRCQICACKCPGAGKWIEANAESRRAFAERTQQRVGALSALGWNAGASTPSAATAPSIGNVLCTAPGNSLAVTSLDASQGPALSLSLGGGRTLGRSLKRLPADIRSELEQAQQAQQELSTVDVLRAWSEGHRGGAGGASLPASPSWEGVEDGEEGEAHHHHKCTHPHDECTSECCSAPNAHPHGHACEHSHDHGASQASLPALAAIAAAAQQAQHAVTAPFLTMGAALGGDLMSAAALQFMQQVMAAGGGAAGRVQELPQTTPPPELPVDVVSLVNEVFLHAAGAAGVQAVCAFLREQRVTCLSDLEYMELSWLCKALQGSAGLPPLLLNKFLQLGRKRAAGTADGGTVPAGAVQGAVRGPEAPVQQRQQQQQQQEAVDAVEHGQQHAGQQAEGQQLVQAQQPASSSLWAARGQVTEGNA